MTTSENEKSLDFDPYQPHNIPLYDMIYGKNLISLGNIAAIDNMFSDLNIFGLKALDIGFGLGGVAFYLAEKFKMSIHGVEVQAWMQEYAKKITPTTLKNSVEFHLYKANHSLPFKAETFDLGYSKGVFNHIFDKTKILQQIYSVLKPQGMLVIADWISLHKMTQSSAEIKDETQESYEEVLTQAGFKHIEFRNDSHLFLTYVEELLKNLNHYQTTICQKYSEYLFSTIKEQHLRLLKQIQEHQKMAIRIIAKKA